MTNVERAPRLLGPYILWDEKAIRWTPQDLGLQESFPQPVLYRTWTKYRGAYRFCQFLPWVVSHLSVIGPHYGDKNCVGESQPQVRPDWSGLPVDLKVGHFGSFPFKILYNCRALLCAPVQVMIWLPLWEYISKTLWWRDCLIQWPGSKYDFFIGRNQRCDLLSGDPRHLQPPSQKDDFCLRHYPGARRNRVTWFLQPLGHRVLWHCCRDRFFLTDMCCLLLLSQRAKLTPLIIKWFSIRRIHFQETLLNSPDLGIIADFLGI